MDSQKRVESYNDSNVQDSVLIRCRMIRNHVLSVVPVSHSRKYDLGVLRLHDVQICQLYVVLSNCHLLFHSYNMMILYESCLLFLFFECSSLNAENVCRFAAVEMAAGICSRVVESIGNLEKILSFFFRKIS